MSEDTLNYHGFQFLLGSLTAKIQASGHKFTHIIGLSRGGIVPAGYLSYMLGIEKVLCVHDPLAYLVSHIYDLQYANILVVDNIASSGCSIEQVTTDLLKLREHGVLLGDVKSAVLVVRERALHQHARKVDFYGQLAPADSRIVFPWDTRDPLLAEPPQRQGQTA